ncbi:MAG TPA: hypothetical protein ENJ87_07275 [Gammaproteobacteria bacterium]|nr:hypothetical protein [Gammaproteobacteria bacterium]
MLNAEDKFSQARDTSLSLKNTDSLDLEQLGELAIEVLNDKNLEVSKVRPFFWSLVEAYVDRFHLYPFDINKALFSYLELNDYPEKTVRKLVEQLETQFEQVHGRSLRKPARLPDQKHVQGDEIKDLHDSLRYAAMVADIDK